MKKLTGKQSKLDLNKNGKLDSNDFKMLRSEKGNGGGLETAKISELKKDMIVYPIYGSYAGKKGYVNKIMPDNKTVEVIFKNKVGNEYVKFEGNELTTNLKYSNGGGTGVSSETGYAVGTNSDLLMNQDYLAYEKGGSLADTPESFPSTDAMSYKNGGPIGPGKKRRFKKIPADGMRSDLNKGETPIKDYVRMYALHPRSYFVYPKDADFENYVYIIEPFATIGFRENGGSTSGWCYSIGGL